jgi:hypothetical protein
MLDQTDRPEIRYEKRVQVQEQGNYEEGWLVHSSLNCQVP